MVFRLKTLVCMCAWVCATFAPSHSIHHLSEIVYYGVRSLLHTTNGILMKFLNYFNIHFICMITNISLYSFCFSSLLTQPMPCVVLVCSLVHIFYIFYFILFLFGFFSLFVCFLVLFDVVLFHHHPNQTHAKSKTYSKSFEF